MKLTICNETIDLLNPPKNLKEKVENIFKQYTSGTNPAYMFCDKLAFIDLIRERVNDLENEDKVLEREIGRFTKYALDNDMDIDKEDYYTTDFLIELVRASNKGLYGHDYSHRSSSANDKCMQTILEIIKVVVNYE